MSSAAWEGRADRRVHLQDLAVYSREVKALYEALGPLAESRLAKTGAWVRATWTLAVAEGALRRTTAAPRAGPAELATLARVVGEARDALRDLQALAAPPASVTSLQKRRPEL
jgi:hypothetical protein